MRKQKDSHWVDMTGIAVVKVVVSMFLPVLLWLTKTKTTKT